MPSTERLVISGNVRFVNKDSEWKIEKEESETVIADGSEKKEEGPSDDNADEMKPVLDDQYEISDDEDAPEPSADEVPTKCRRYRQTVRRQRFEFQQELTRANHRVD